MRILSQENLLCRDLPYESTVLFIESDGKEIKALSGGIVYSIATYSTEEKAKKAMEMLHNEYKQFQTTKTNSGFYFAFDYPKVFQFPSDEEIEV